MPVPRSARPRSAALQPAALPPITLRSAALPALLSFALVGLLTACGSSAVTPVTPAACGAALRSASVQAVIAAPLGVTPHALSSADWQAPHVAGEVLVNGSAAQVQALGEAARALGGVQLQAVSGSALLRASTPAGERDEAFAQRLQAAGLSVQPNYLYKPLGLPNDPGYPGNGGVTVGSGSYTQAYLPRIDAAAGWTSLQSLCGSVTGTKTAVLDTGTDATHPDLTGRVLSGYDFGDGDSNAADDSSDAGHGTGVSGVIAATGNNGVGLTGLSWTGQSLLPVKVFDKDGNATTAGLTAGINYAVAQGARVINMSLGAAGLSDTALAAAIQAAASNDVVMVASAGNTPGDGVYYPASDPNVIAVGALDDSNSLACYSARPNATSTRALDLVAPGGQAAAFGVSGCSGVKNDLLLVLTSVKNGSYTTEAGTSFSSPMVAGAAALLRAYRPGLSAAQVRTILTSSAQTVSGGKLLDVGAAVTLAGTY